MATLDYTGDAAAGAVPPNQFEGARSGRVDMYRRLKAADIIAADADMTTNGYITADDIIQALHIPIGFIFEGCAVRVITPSTNACNVEVGTNGNAEALASMDIDGTAGVITATITTDSWAHGKCFYAADTIDVQYITANCTDGEIELFVWGTQLLLGLTTDFTTGA